MPGETRVRRAGRVRHPTRDEIRSQADGAQDEDATPVVADKVDRLLLTLELDEEPIGVGLHRRFETIRHHATEPRQAQRQVVVAGKTPP
jgi:hypothetical protein